MRRILLLIAAALSAGLVYAQDAENVGNSAQLSIIPRIDLNPFFGFDGSGTEFSLSNSSLCTLLEGDLGSSFSYSMAAQWLSETPSDLYHLWHADEANFLKWAYLTFQPGDFGISAGKQYINVASFEYDEYDWDMQWDLASTMWNEYQVYQMGASVNWDYADESSLILQATASPFSEHPFDDGLAVYTLFNTRQRGDFTWMASASLLGYEPSKYVKLLNYCMSYPIGSSWSAKFDYGYRWAQDLHVKEHTAICAVSYEPSDDFSLTFKYGYETCKRVNGLVGELYSKPENVIVGLQAYYYPIENLRLHSVVAYSSDLYGLSVNVGLTYNLVFNL